jgi:hypothetical protein
MHCMSSTLRSPSVGMFFRLSLWRIDSTLVSLDVFFLAIRGLTSAR